MSSENLRKIDNRKAPQALVIFEAIRREGEHQLARPSLSLAWSALAAGLSMGFSFISEALLGSYLPDAEWTPLISKFGYSIGFLIVILGRQQLFTENTLTPVLQLLDKKSARVFKNLMRLWGIVFIANILGTMLFAWTVSTFNTFTADVYTQFDQSARGLVETGTVETFFSGILAGWLIALIIWLLPFAEQARIWIIIIITYIIGLGKFSHIIAGSVEGFYGLFAGQIVLSEFLINFFIPTVLGNIVGGVALVAVFNYAQVTSEHQKEDT